VYEKLVPPVAKELPCVLEFVTRKYPAGIHSYQKQTNAEGENYAPGNEPALSQYALVLEKDFEIVWKEL
jgi:hypothetical protein